MTDTKIDNILVIKVGTSTLTKTDADGRVTLDAESFKRLGRQITALRQAKYSVVIVSSAAITAGMVETNLTTRPNTATAMASLQRLASIGWRHILNAWDTAMPGLTLGELLLTKRELDSKDERTEVLHVAYELMKHGDIPVINENDAITHEEIAFGDNDTLAAIFATKLKRSSFFSNNVSLIILSDIDGVYKDVDDKASLIPQINDIAAYQHMAKQSSSAFGTGGMITKFAAATIATQQGVDTYITHGRVEATVQRALAKEIGTHFSTLNVK